MFNCSALCSSRQWWTLIRSHIRRHMKIHSLELVSRTMASKQELSWYCTVCSSWVTLTIVMIEPSRFFLLLRSSLHVFITQNGTKLRLKFLEWEENQLKVKNLVRHQRAHLPWKNVKLGAEQHASLKQQGAII